MESDSSLKRCLSNDSPHMIERKSQRVNLDNTRFNTEIKQIIDEGDSGEESGDSDYKGEKQKLVLIKERPMLHDGTFESYRLNYEQVPQSLSHVIKSLYSTAFEKVQNSKIMKKLCAKIIQDPNHRCFGEYGVFALDTIHLGSQLPDYSGIVKVEVKKNYDITDNYGVTANKGENNPSTFEVDDGCRSRYVATLFENDEYVVNIDAEIEGNITRFINDPNGMVDCNGFPKRPNVIFSPYVDKNSCESRYGIICIRTIEKGDEVLLDYGSSFFGGSESSDSYSSDSFSSENSTDN